MRSEHTARCETERSGFNALGHEVPEWRLTAAYKLLKSWNIGTEDAQRVIGRIAHHIEEDEPYKAQRIATGGAPLDRPASSATESFPYPKDVPNLKLGVTAGLRLYCVLLAEGRPSG